MSRFRSRRRLNKRCCRPSSACGRRAVSSSRTETGDTPNAVAATTVDVTMPQMGVSVAEGTVVAWRVEVGDTIEADATICEISTDKIDTEVPAPVSGVVTEILVAVETTVPVGTVLARISAGGGGEGTVEDAPPASEMEAAADEPGAAQPDTTAPDPTKAQATGAQAAGSERAPSGNGASAVSQPSRADGRRYSPVVSRIAAEHGIDLSQVPGTGRAGRVRKQDVLAFIESGAPADAPLHIES